jgi:glutathione S-transferase
VFPPERRDAALAEQADKVLRPKLKVLDDYLTTHKHFGGGRWDMADFMIASVISSLLQMKYDFSAFPKLESWLKASLARSGAQETLKLRAA